MHGFDEFFGNLYHLNAEEEPELPNYPPADDFPHFRERFAPRGVIHSWATDEDDPTEEPRFGRVGRQRIEDTGPLNRKRMETIDDEVLAVAQDFIGRQQASDTPFFVWFNTTHMHFRTHPKPESVGQAGRWQSPYHDTMIDHDRVVGALLDTLDELGLAENTIVLYSTDNGPHMNTWPDGGHDAVPRREEHQLGGRLPRPGDDPLAGEDRRRHRLERDRRPPRLAADLPCRGRRARHHREAQGRPPDRRDRPTRSTSTATTCCPT